MSNDRVYESDDEDRLDRMDARITVYPEGEQPQFEEGADSGFVYSTLKTKTTPPWAGSIKAPTNAPSNDPSPPTSTIKLEWVYGFRSDDSFDNIAITSSGKIVYPAAAVVVCYDKDQHAQTHMLEHNDDILCLAQCRSNPNLVATGQNSTLEIGNGYRRSVDPYACVWDTATGEKWKINSVCKKACRCISFSQDGKYLAACAYDTACTINIWDYKSSTKFASTSADQMPHKLFGCVWSPEGYNFVTFGVDHLMVWAFDGDLKKSRVRISAPFEQQSMYCAEYLSPSLIAVGTKNGHIYFVEDGQVTRQNKNAHAGPVFVIKQFGLGYISGGKDRKLNVYDGSDKLKYSFELSSYPRSLAFEGGNRSARRCVVGLREGVMLEIDIGDPQSATTELVHGHWDGELWGLDVDPKDPNIFISAGEDNTMFKWNKSTHRMEKRAKFSKERGIFRHSVRARTTSSHGINHCARSVCIDQQSNQFVLGCNDGKISVFDYKSFELIKNVDLNAYSKRNITDQEQNWIQVIKYSPDGTTLAVGTHASVVVLLDAKAFTCKKTLDKHNSAVVHIDWSQDSKFMQTNAVDYELLFWNINTANLSECKQNPNSSQTNDVEWAGQTCKMGWAVRGIWEAGMDGTDINAVDRSPDGSLIVSADDWGRVNLYRNPVGDNNLKTSYSNGHSSHVMASRFTLDGRHIISAGGNDKTVLQWAIDA